ncbi:uncharacterized protein LOC143148279 isoform X2 [Ptiloglossa arizonensis]|uniref:uncharacterized protein LOC143148279 isoform X2 n=1 Tax=Ptiloglossa arizonensis TaxID=3350558 RepID=UPI003F9FC201
MVTDRGFFYFEFNYFGQSSSSDCPRISSLLRILASKRVRKSSKNRLVHLLANEMSEPCSARAWNRPLTSLTVFSRKFCIIDFPEISDSLDTRRADLVP